MKVVGLMTALKMHIMMILFRGKKVKRDTVYVLFFNDPTKSHSLPFPSSFKFFDREI